LEHRIGDRRILRLIRKWLHAGVIEEGQWSETTEGSPQGSVISPLLSNVYLHYVFDLWIEWWRKHNCRRDVVVVRYAYGTASDQSEAANANAPTTWRNGTLVATRRPRVAELSHRPGQQQPYRSFRWRGNSSVVAGNSLP
jgi:hypothetical protein